MSGIAGCLYFENEYQGSLVDKITAMLTPLPSAQEHQIRYRCDREYCALGICNSNNVNTAKIMSDNNSDYIVAFNGSLYNAGNLISLLDSGKDFEGQLETEIILRLFEKYENRLVDFLQGMFAFAIWDKKQKNLIIASDRHGYEFIYYYKDRHRFLFASEVKSILAILDSRPEPDLDSICDIHNFNAIFNTKTAFKNIHLMPHAGICCVNKDSCNIKQYWDYPISVDHFKDSENQLMNRAKVMIQNAVQRSISNSKNLGIMLSGGLDSRLLAAVLRQYSKNIKAFSFQWGELKLRETYFAEKIADRLGVEFHCLEEPQMDDLELINRSSLDSDGQWGFYEVLPYIVQISQEYPGTALVNGYLMDTLFKSGWAFFPSNGHQRLTADQIIKRHSTMGDYVSDAIFTPEFSETIKKKKRETIEIAMGDFPISKPAEVSLRFYCINRGRRSLISHIRVLKRYLNIILPGIDYELTDFAFRLPYRLRSTTEFYRRLIYTWFPEIGKIPWDRTGKPLDKGISERKKKLEARLFTAKYAIQRATKGKIDLLNSPISFNRRFRNDKKFRELIMEILFDRKTLSRGFFDRNGIEALIKRQLSGRDHDKAFKSIISVELLHRNFIDG